MQSDMWSVLVLACILCASTAARPVVQYNASIYIYPQVAPLAQWSELPFRAPVAQSAYLPQRDCFLLLLADGSVVTAAFSDTKGEAVFTTLSTTPRLPFVTQRFVIGRNTSAFDLIVVGVASSNVSAVRCNVIPSSGMLDCSLGPWQQSASVPLRPFAHINDATLVTYVLGSDVMLVATNDGLVRVEWTGMSMKASKVVLHNTTGALVTNSDVTRLWCSSNDVPPTAYLARTCLAATAEHTAWANLWTSDLVHLIQGDAKTLHEAGFVRCPGVLDSRPTAFVYDARTGSVAMPSGRFVNVFHQNGTMERLSGYHGGLPRTNSTSASTAPHASGVWYGSLYGGMLRRHDGTWKYFSGPRWLPGPGDSSGMNVTTVAVAAAIPGREIAMLTTDGGVSFIYLLQNWSLERKAKAFQDVVYPRHDRYGLCTDVSLTKFGDLTTYEKHPTANDGLWTGIYVLAESFRFAVTGDAGAKANAWKSLNGMGLLINYTGNSGYPARSVDQRTHCVGTNDWYVSPVAPGWCFMSDTSSDEITGHLSSYPIAHDLVTESAQEKAILLDRIRRITSNIVDHGLTLYDPATGQPTEWGHWSPNDLNDNPIWYDDRGVNSLQILAFLSNAYRLTGNESYAAVFEDLVVNHSYADSMLNLKVTQPSDINYSDDELTYLPYLALLWSGRPSALMAQNKLFLMVKEKLFLSIQRTQGFVRKERPSLWSVIFVYVTQQLGFQDPNTPTDVANALWCLDTWPVSWIDWPINNSARLDLVPNPNQDRFGQYNTLTETLVPYDEITLSRWNSDPFRTVQGSGWSEYDPSAWLLPYWLGKYAKLF